MRILLVDDHAMFLQGLRLMLEKEQPAGTLIEAVTHGAAALEHAATLNPELVVMDIHLPDGDGIEVARQILTRAPGVKIIVLTGESNLNYINRALQAGVLGYLRKEDAPEELPRAIAAVMEGRYYLCPEANTAVLLHYTQTLGADPSHPKPVLSSREREVLCLIAEGWRTKEIAEKLQVGVKTAETYRRRLQRKLGCAGTADLVRYAIREGMISG